MSRFASDLWICLMVLCCGCAMGRPSSGPVGAFPAGTIPQSQTQTSPTQVVPQTDPFRSNKPVTPDSTPSPTTPDVVPSDAPPWQEPDTDEQKSNKRLWQPLDAPDRDPVDADPTEIELGRPQAFPANGPAQARQTVEPVSGTISPASQSRPTGWKNTLQSTSGRPIQTAEFGQGPQTIVITGSIYGNEPESLELMDALLQELSTAQLPERVGILLIRTPNPDGAAEHIRTNQRGVDLNRNFPSTWFTANPNHQTGPHPASELETQHLVRLFKEKQPVRVIHVRSSVGQRPLVLFNSQWAEVLDKSALPQKVAAGRFGGEYKAGSLEEFVSIRVRAELGTVHLPPRGFQQMSNGDLLRLALHGIGSATTTTPVADVAGRDAPAAQAKNQVTESEQNGRITGDGKQGFVELLSPPPEFDSANASARYYELPPPPE